MKILGSLVWGYSLVLSVGLAASCSSSEDDGGGAGGEAGSTQSPGGDAGASAEGGEENGEAGQGSSVGGAPGVTGASSCEDVADGAGDCMGYYGAVSGTVAEKACLINQCIECEEDSAQKGMCEFVCPDTCADLYADFLDCMFAMDCSGDTESSVSDQTTVCRQTLSSSCGF